jgi:Ni/Co efflux regulator RcnB
MMKRVLAYVLMVSSFACAIPSQAQIYRGPNSAQQAQKAARKDQKRAAKRQRKASKKLLKTQRKAAKRAKHRG